MKRSLVKNLSIAGFTLSAMSFAALSFAAGAPQATAGAGSVDSSMIVSAINDLNQNMQKLAIAKAQANNADNYQDSASFAQAAQVNTGKNQTQLQEYPGAQGVSAIGQQEAANITEHQNKNSLSAFSDSALTYNGTSSDVEAALARNKKRDEAINKYSWLTKASDSIYTELGDGNPETQKPTDLHNNYFNFSNLIDPMSYTPAQQDATKNFITYISQQYQPLSSSINFDQFRAYLKGLKPNKVSDALKSFATSSSYEQFQLTARQIIAERSIALNNFNELSTERSPIKSTQANAQLDALSKAIGVTPSTEKDPKTGNTVYLYASPLQISNFVTTHRTSSPQWYQQMMAASPATVQRETLFVMAEMEAEMQRQHLDNERILATLSASEMQGATGQMNSLKALANDINQQITTLASANNKSAIQPINGPNSGSGSNSGAGSNNPGQGYGFGTGSNPTSTTPAGK